MFADGCLIVAEVGQAHDGSLGTAHAFIDAAAESGAGAVKFQTHIASAESTPDEPWRVRFSSQDETRYDYWQRMQFTNAQWIGLGEHAHERGLKFLSSPFSLEAVDLLRDAGIDAFKIASGEVNNTPLLKAIAACGLPTILSSGMSPWSELDVAVETLETGGFPIAVLQCTSEYPCPPELVGLNVIEELKARYGHAVGLSDHSGTIFAGLAAATLGIQVLEVHVTMSRQAFGPDVPASVTFDELSTLVSGVNFIERARTNPVDKEAMSVDLEDLRRVFTKSIVAARSLQAGMVLSVGDLALKKPGNGIPATELPSIVGRKLLRPIAVDQQLSLDDLTPVV